MCEYLGNTYIFCDIWNAQNVKKNQSTMGMRIFLAKFWLI